MAPPAAPDGSESELPTAAVGPGFAGTPSLYPTQAADASGAIPGAMPATIGPYRLDSKLGEGGFGEVYAADQTAPVRRRVALKILKVGMDTKAVLARFEAERQALARMDHPNIATVLDAGMTEQGRSYFVMEFVRGEPITAYCDRHTLDIRARLELFILVCNAVQHAHQKGIIHRDLKPSNILVTMVDERAMPKVIDFGIAKATSEALTTDGVRTVQGEMIGTPEYMSPEQADPGAVDVDTRADIYSLGVVLYELLSGELPFESNALRRGGWSELQRILREQEPKRPSTKLTASGDGAGEIAKKRGTELRTLARELKDDLDWVVLKALEKDRSRRYESASALAQELRRYLSHEPLLAGPPGASYRMEKFVRRHRAAVAGGALVVLALLVGMAGLGFGLVRAQKAETEARRESATSKRVLDFMVGLFQVADPSEARGNSITAREILDKGVAEIGKGLESEPAAQFRLMTTMGNVYKELGLYQPSRDLLERSLAIQEKDRSGSESDLATALSNLANVKSVMGEHAEARQLYERSLAIQERTLGPDDPEVAGTLHNLAILLRRTGDYTEAQRVVERALAIHKKTYGPEDPIVADTETILGAIFQSRGKVAEAKPLFEHALAVREKEYGPDHVIVAQSVNNLAAAYWQEGDAARAKPLWERALAIWEKVLGPDHPDVASGLNNLAAVHYTTEDYAGAKALWERALAIQEKTLGPAHEEVAVTLGNLAGASQAMGDRAEAKRLGERALAIMEKALGPDHPQVGLALQNMAELYRDSGETARARRYYERAAAILEASLGPDHALLASNFEGYAVLLRSSGEAEKAESFEARAKEIREKNKPPA